MKFTGTVEKAVLGFDIQSGDAVRRRDLFTPYYHLKVRLSAPDRKILPELSELLLYSFAIFSGSLQDEFDPAACLQRTKFSRLQAGSELIIQGAVYPLLAHQTSERFGGFCYAILDPLCHGRQVDINGDLQMGVSDWLIETESIREEGVLCGVSSLLVAWECADFAGVQHVGRKLWEI